jgi:hypothetical protein
MALENYEGPAEIYAQGRLLAECQKFSLTVKGNNNKVFTMKRGLAGKSDGPRESEATIENAIPRKGYDVDFMTHCVKGKVLSITYKSGGKRHTLDMWVEDVQSSNATDSPAVLQATLNGGPPKSVG